MNKSNPAVYECPKGKWKLHSWRRIDNGAKCVYCGLEINKFQADEVFNDLISTNQTV